MKSSVIQGIFPAGVRGGAGAVQRYASGNAVALPLGAMVWRGAGRPLPAAIRQPMESFFGTRFDDVRIHVGAQTAAIGAIAFTQGSDIHIAPGHYDPSTPHGQTILAHELAHVVQQRSGRVRNPFGGGVAIVHDRALEAEAARMERGALAACMQAKMGLNALQLRPKNPADVARYFQRRAWAQNWVRAYARQANMKPAWYGHLFRGLPLAGPRDPSAPTGFHTYADKPGNIVVLARRGRQSTFHVARWRYNDSPVGVTKDSSMFPNRLTKTQVLALVLIDTKDAWVNPPQDFPPKVNDKAVTWEMLCTTFGLTTKWELVQTGDTVYPRPK